MTAIPSTPRNTVAASGSPLHFGAGSYTHLLRQQFETTLQLTTAWAAAVSAMTGGLQSRIPNQADGAPDRVQPESPQLTVIPGDAEGTPTAPPGPTGRGFLDGAEDLQRRPRMFDWLTGAPTLQPNLFDEAVVLLVDEDIKTAS